MPTVPTAKTLELTDSELIDSLRHFPDGVLPVGVLSELTTRGEAIQPELLRRLESAMDDADAGIGAVPGECFFCVGLLLAYPGKQQLPTLERILRLDRERCHDVAGELVYETFHDVFRGIAKADGSSSVLSWIDPLVRDETIDEFVRPTLFSVLPFLVNDETFPRGQAIDWIVELLQEREKSVSDALSAFALIELSHLGAVELEEFAKKCFERNQIDESIYCLNDWHRECQATIAGESPFSVRHEISDPAFLDIVDRLKFWHGFSEISVSLHSSEATFETNPDRSGDIHRRPLRATEIDEHIQSFRDSHFDDFPREAFDVLRRDVMPLRDRLVEEVRVGLRNTRDSGARDSNGPFLALVLLISRRVRLPVDLLLEIIDLPVDQFEDLFGDSLDQPLVTALSQSIVADTSRIEERLTDFERSGISRSMLAEFFPFSAFLGHLTREEAIEALHKAWRSTLDAEGGQYSQASGALLESLCLMSSQQHKQELFKEIESGKCGPYFGTAELREMLKDPGKGIEYLRSMRKRTGNPMYLVESSVMFSEACIRPEVNVPRRIRPADVLQPSQVMEVGDMSPATVRNTVPATGRNAACPCGSGRKYKKCCLRKR